MSPSALRHFSPAQAFKDITAIHNQTRWCTSPRIDAAAEYMRARLARVLGKDAQVLRFPCDGKTFHGGWVMPQCWDVKRAELRVVEPHVSQPMLSDFNDVPLSLMLRSPATPRGGIEGAVVIVPKPHEYRGNLRGKFVLLDSGSWEITEFLARRGAIGMILDGIPVVKDVREGAYLDRASLYCNGVISPIEEAHRIPGFAISAENGRILRELLAAGRPVRLKATVDAKFYDGTMPVVSALLRGRSYEEIILTAHMDEPGASDNASGTAIAMELLRALAAFTKARGKPLKRSVRFYSSVEVRGLQALVNRPGLRGYPMAGLNLDMLGYELKEGRTYYRIEVARPYAPSFLEPLLVNLAREEARHSPAFHWKRKRSVIVDDAHFSCLPWKVPMCILGQWPDRTYHTSLDTPDNLSVEHIGRVGRMLMKAVLFMADADPEDVRALSKKVVANAHANLKAGEIPPERTLAHTKTILRQLSRLMPMNMRMEERHDIVEMRRKNQLVHGYLFQRPAFDMDAAKWMAKLTARVPKSQRTAAPIVRHPGGSLVPLKQFAGYLGGEHLSARECAQLYKSAGLYFGWGTNSWLQWAMDLANGKQTLDEIFHSLSQEGSKLKFESLLLAFRFFEKKGMVRFRPHLSARELLAAVRKVGIRPGDLVIAHTSLSEFGYFEGGPDTVIDALLKAVGPRGTLAVPTHSNSFIGNQPYDPETSPSLVGAVTERFLKRPGVIRSAHPSHSVAAFGPLAKELTDGHDHTIAPQGREGFWGKFVDAGGKVLLLCKLTSNTLLHSAELWAGVPYPPGQLHYMKNGKRIEVTTPGMPFHISSFAAVHEALARKRMLYKTKLGNGTIYSMRARDAIDVGMPIFQKNPILATKRGCPCRWCDYIRRHLGQPGALTAGS